MVSIIDDFGSTAHVTVADVDIALPIAGRRLLVTSGARLTLPSGVQAMELNARAQAAGISVAPGNMFSATDAFGHCIRLNYSFPWDRETEQAVRLLGQIAHELAARTPRQPAAASRPAAPQVPASGLTKAS